MSGESRDTVRFELHLDKEAYDALLRLHQLTGKETLYQTLLAALNLYGVQDRDGILCLKD